VAAHLRAGPMGSTQLPPPPPLGGERRERPRNT
jgi:hypothetical protein